MILNQPLRVMIVDDNDMVRMALAVFLGTRNDLVFVGEAADGEQAVRCVSQVQPDVILMDRKLPGMDGISATRLIKDQYPDVRVLLLSGDFSEADREKALWAGVSECVHKSISNDQLATAILAMQTQ
jgi:NarL family two-component system response regulator LiaR